MIRHLLSKRFVRILLWLLTTLATLVVLLYVWTNWSGRRRWAETRAMLEHEGETLEFRKLLPETPPETENLLAIEPLKGITEAVDHDDSKGEPGAKRKALAAMRLAADAPSSRGVERGVTADMQAWVKFLRESGFLHLPVESAAPGSEVLKALDDRFPLLKQLADLAPQRSRAMFTPGLRERELPELLFSLSLRHYSGAQNLARLLCLRARAAIDAKQGAAAARSLLAAEKTGQACETEPLLIGVLVGVAMETSADEVLWLGLRERAFDDKDLQLLQQFLGSHDQPKALLQAFRGEMAVGLSSMEYLQEIADGRKKAGPEAAAAFAGGRRGQGLKAMRFLPGGMFDHWKSVIAGQEWQHVIAPLRQGGLAAAVKAGDGISAELNEKRNYLLHPDYIMARLVVPAIHGICASALNAEARQRQALTAIMLERFFLKHARYPARLRELVPEFAAAVPPDPWDGKEMRYRPTAAGRYMLWCVGLDGKDDDGQVKEEGVPMKNAHYLGDWTWQYEPVK